MQDFKELFKYIGRLEITKILGLLTFILICCKLAPDFSWCIVLAPAAFLVLILIGLTVYGSSRRDKNTSN